MRSFISMMWAKWMLAGCLSLFMLSACDKEDGPAPEVPVERVVLMYIAGDNSLSAFPARDLDEVREGMANVPASFLFFAYVDTGSGNPQLLKFRSRGNGTISEEVVKEYDDRNSVGVTETQEVFNDVFGNPAYQADSYGLIYWSHCDGWIPYPMPSNRWIGQDRGDGDNRMNLSDFKEILATAPHLDFLMFDACFMQSIEVAYELRDYTDYYIASPTETPGPGAPYDVIMPYLAQVGASESMANAYFETYNALYNGGIGISNTNWTGGASICALRTDGLEALAALTAQLMPETAVDVDAFCENVFNYDQRDPDDWFESHIGYYDWAQLMENLLSEADYTTWRQAYDEAVTYWNTTPMNYSSVVGMFSMEGTNGVTHYIPQSVTSPRAESYRSLDWYTAAGLAKLGW